MNEALNSLLDKARNADTLSKRQEIYTEVEAALRKGVNLEELARALATKTTIDQRRNVVSLKIGRALEALFPPLLQFRYEFVSEVLVPPMEVEIKPIGPGIEEYQKPELIPRLQYLLEVLQGLSIDTTSLNIIRGEVSPNMMRRESYAMVIIPSLERMVLVCDEEGNRTFVIRGDISHPEKYYRFNKAQLSELVEQGIAKDFIWTNEVDWKQTMVESLLSWPGIEAGKEMARMENQPFVGGDGVVIIQGRKYRHVLGFSRLLGIARGKIKKVIDQTGLKGIRGKSIGGECTLFLEDEVMRLLEDFQRIPISDKKGILVHDEKQYMNVPDLADFFSISIAKIIRAVKTASLKGIKGRKPHKKPTIFYPVEEVRELLGDFPELPRADKKSNLVIIGEINYMPTTTLARMANTNFSTVQRIIESYGVEGIRARGSHGEEFLFYPVDKVMQLIADFQALPKVDKESKRLVNERCYRNVTDLAERLGVADRTISAVIKKTKLEGIRARDAIGKEIILYPEDEVRRLISK